MPDDDYDTWVEQCAENAFNDFEAFLEKHTSKGYYKGKPAKLMEHMLSNRSWFSFTINKAGNSYNTKEE